MLENRITELESRFAFQESMIQDLNDVIVKQQKKLDEMALSLQVVKDQLESIMPALVAPESEESPPPHY